ncbi:hypothetical protein CAPTEDRAFT_220398 [Capitella teleta]|uniref:Uncharacterized protein n=1 Tax=Capitella teleta TaxID=283909 RepID=R7VKM5_CAPTE|nr:hypothetical protein CAPTEDRAFT_220398 [Capitella teleta]|eukprot:ELU16885.1 hypothetical protein CAPTEDRAFT_220398 [Capitella teleta]
MADAILRSLQQLRFPECCLCALDHLSKLIAQDMKNTGGQKAPAMASINGLSMENIGHVIDRYIFCMRENKSPTLSDFEVLQLLEIISSFFERQSNAPVAQVLFRFLFNHNLRSEQDFCLRVFCRLVSFAVATSSKCCLDYAADLAQMEGCISTPVVKVMQTLVNDYCDELATEASSLLRNLPKLSTQFTCAFVTTISATYHCPGSTQLPTVSFQLLKILAHWIQEEPSLCLLSLLNREPHKALWTSPSKPNTQTAIPNLLAWSIKAPCMTSADAAQWNDVWSMLHLALLSCVLSFPSLPGANQLELVTLADMNRIVRDTLADNPPAEERINRLVQALQVCLTTGAFRCSLGDLRKICTSLPSNRLLELVSMQHLSTAPPQMHNVSS